MVWPCKKLLGGRHFDDPTQIHNGYTVCEMFDNPYIMADKKVGQFQFFAQFHKEVQHLSLNRDIQCGNCLIAYNEFGLNGQRPRNTDALPLAAGELVRISSFEARVEPHPQQDVIHIRLYFGSRNETVYARCLSNNVAHTHARIQRSQRVLKDHLNVESYLSAFIRGHAGHVLSAIEDSSLARAKGAGDNSPDRRLAAAGLSDKTDDFPGIDVQVYAVHSLDHLLTDVSAEQVGDLFRQIKRFNKTLGYIL